MCGIFGIIVKPGASYKQATIGNVLKNLALLSESRGKDSSGIAFRNEASGSINVLKGDVPVSDLLKHPVYAQNLAGALNAFGSGSGFSAFGHARLVTNGSQLQDVNNQPVVKDNILIIHNGIVVNVDDLWNNNKNISREYKIDTEVIPALIRMGIKSGKNLLNSCSEAFNQVQGTFSVAIMLADFNEMVFATNNGSFYILNNLQNDFLLFASEKIFLQKLLDNNKINKTFGPCQIHQLKNGTVNTINLNSFKILVTDPQLISGFGQETQQADLEIKTYGIESTLRSREVIVEVANINLRSESSFERSLLEFNDHKIRLLKRCTKCVLPETFPYIEFDDSGVCNYCNNYKLKNQPKPLEKLVEMVEPYRNGNGKPDCLIPFSGGRDSTYTLHVVKNELNMNPITLTYDWGMVTDLARRNIARVCGKLGVENIIVAADLHVKRRNIRNNVSAWLKNPHLGMVPLFMAGDKYFFYYSNLISKQNDLKLSFWGSNPLENTDFKTGFTGISPDFNKERIDKLSAGKKIKLISFFGRQYLSNPGYLNSSLYDTLGSFLSRYWIKRVGYIQIFDYIKWDQDTIENLILNEYDWERAIDTKSTWRIGDGTASFYNYIYYTVAGFSEYETFISNQIREGQMSRKEGISLIFENNIPRYENIKWYLDIIGLDFKDTILKINKIPKLYN